MEKHIYLDNAAGYLPFPETLPSLDCPVPLGNPSSPHRSGTRSREIIESVREQVAAALGTDPDQIIFTSGGTESNNLAITGCLTRNRGRGGNIVVSPIEHLSVLESCRSLSSWGFELREMPVGADGVVDVSGTLSLIDNETRLVALQSVNNETGVVQKVQELARAVKRINKRVWTHCDHVQGFLKHKLDTTNLDSVSVSAHKVGGWKGVGALCLSNPQTLTPIFRGGDQEKGIRPGTENLQGIEAWGRSITAFEKFWGSGLCEELTGEFISQLEAEIPEAEINGAEAPRVPGIVSVNFKSVPGEILRNVLDEQRVYVSTQSACKSSRKDISHVLRAMGIREDRGTIRFSFGWQNTEEEVRTTVRILRESLNRLGSLR